MYGLISEIITKLEKILAHIFDKGLVLKIYEELNKTTTQKGGKNWTEICSKNIYKCPISIERCSTSLVFRKMQVKSTRRTCFTTSRVARIRNIITRVGEDVEKFEPWYIGWRKCKMIVTSENILAVSQEKHRAIVWPSNSHNWKHGSTQELVHEYF